MMMKSGNKNKPIWKRALLKLGHIQAQVILLLLFWLVLTPYALILQLIGYKLMPGQGWHKLDAQSDLESLRRIF